MGKEQKYYFHLSDVAALIKLPWSWPLGESTWDLTTRLIASAGLLTETNESSLMMTAVPVLALSGWKGLVTFDTGVESRILQQPYSSECKTSVGPVQIVATMGIQISPFLTPTPVFVSNTSPMPACTDRPVSAWTCIS